ncbi:hypothetical protein Gotur_015914 [Gossypium turneri]
MGQYNWILDLLQLGVLFAIMIETELLDITGSLYIPREQNQVADCLAKQALIEKDNLQVLDVPPLMARTFIDMNKSTDANRQTLLLRIALTNMKHSMANPLPALPIVKLD